MNTGRFGLKLVLAILLACPMSWAQASTGEAPVTGGQVALPPAMAAQLDPASADLLTRLQKAARHADEDVLRLRIDRWKTRGDTKEQALQNTASIHRNLAYAVPELLRHVEDRPTSIKANFALYRDLTVLYEALYSLSQVAEAYGPPSEYTYLIDDLTQLNQLRRELADRVEQLSALSDAGRLRPFNEPAATSKKAPTSTVKKIVVDDTQSKRKSSTKSAPSKK